MPYQLADKSRKQLNQAALKREKQAKAKLLLDFDELNVLRQIDALYSDLDKQTRRKLEELWLFRFREVCKKKPDEGFLDELLDMHLAGILDEPNETTHYTYSLEVLRKRDRAKEAILSVPTKAQKQLMLDKHMSYFLQMAAWYIDFTSQDAEISALSEDGVKRVRRHEQKDAHVCAICKAADGTVYEIDKIPPLPHLNCRRYFTPVK